MKPDFTRIAAETCLPGGDRYNFHSHTQFCDGRDTMEEIAAAAVSAGMREMGFTPHSPVPIESPCNMSADDVPEYLSRVTALNDTYAGRCRFYAGMEIDYLGRESNAAAGYYSDLGLDYSISSIHFIPSQDGDLIDIDGHYDRFARNMHDRFHDDLDYVVSTFFERSMQMLSTGGFDILGHFDKVAQNASMHRSGLEETARYNDLLDSYIEQIVESGVVVEINTKARAEHGRYFPHERLWRRLIDSGVPLIVNSDVHRAALVDASRHEAVEILKTLRNER